MAAYRRGDGRLVDVATTFAVNPRTLQRWMALDRTTGSLCPRPKAGGWRCPIVLPVLHTVLADAPDATSAELCWEYNRRGATDRPDDGDPLPARDAPGGLCVQNKRPRPSEIDRPDVAATRRAFLSGCAASTRITWSSWTKPARSSRWAARTRGCHGARSTLTRGR